MAHAPLPMARRSAIAIVEHAQLRLDVLQRAKGEAGPAGARPEHAIQGRIAASPALEDRCATVAGSGPGVHERLAKHRDVRAASVDVDAGVRDAASGPPGRAPDLL